jgi:hypothetical protein
MSLNFSSENDGVISYQFGINPISTFVLDRNVPSVNGHRQIEVMYLNICLDVAFFSTELCMYAMKTSHMPA